MIIYGLMKHIEKIPIRYDVIMNLLTLGYHSKSRKVLVKAVSPNKTILDIGCGTGEFAIEAAKKGARVYCIDASPEMLRIFQEKLNSLKKHLPGAADNIIIYECGAASINVFLKDIKFDLIFASLMLGELPAPVQEKTLAQAASMLKNNGQLIVCDEFWPDNHVKSLVYHLLFWIFYIPNFILTRTLIQPVKNFNSHINKAGLKIKRKLNLFMGAMTIYWLEKK